MCCAPIILAGRGMHFVVSGIRIVLEYRIAIQGVVSMGKVIKKWGVLILVAASLIMTIVNIYNSIVHKVAVNWVSLTSLAPVFVALYNESDWIYVKWNKLCSWLKKNTVSFSSSFFVYTDEEINFNKLQSRISEAMNACELKFQKGSKRELDSDYFKTTLKTKNGLRFDLSMSIEPDDMGKVIAVTLEYQISSRNIKSSWLEFKHFRNEFVNGLRTNKQRYNLTIDMTETGLNPFYRLTLKSVDAKNLKDVQLKFKEKGLSVETTQNRIAASSDNPDSMDKIVEQYIPLTSVY